MSAPAAGETRRLNRPTFLHNGIFVMQGIQVTVKGQDAEGLFQVEYIDREGHPHLLDGVRADELE